MEFGTRLKDLRENARDPISKVPHKLSQEDLGRLLRELVGVGGYDVSTISRWENNKSKIDAGNRALLVGLVTVLFYHHSLEYLEDANELLELGHYRRLGEEEVADINNKLGGQRGYRQLISRPVRDELPECIGRDGLLLNQMESGLYYNSESYDLYGKFPAVDRTITLNELSRRLNEDYGDRLIVSFVDVDKTPIKTPAEFWSAALRPIDGSSDPEMRSHIQVAIEEIRRAENYHRLERLFHAVALHNNRRFVLFIDSFDSLLDKPGFGNETQFFITLRSLSQRFVKVAEQMVFPFCFVLASRISTSDMLRIDQYRPKLWGFGSPFSNGVVEKELRSLDKDEIDDLLNELGYEETMQREIIRAVGYQPILLRELLVVMQRTGATPAKALDELAVMPKVVDFLDDLWEGQTNSGKAILLSLTIAEWRTWLAEHLEIIVEFLSAEAVLNTLVNYGLVRDFLPDDEDRPIRFLDSKGRRWVIGYHLLGRYIREQVIDEPRENFKYGRWFGQEPGERWLDENKWQQLVADIRGK